MIRWFKEFDPVMLIFLAIIPPGIYGFGFIKTGIQIFDMSEVQSQKIVVKENPINEDNELKPLNEIEEEAENLQEKKRQQDASEEEMRKGVQTLRKKVTTLGNVSRPKVVDTVRVVLQEAPAPVVKSPATKVGKTKFKSKSSTYRETQPPAKKKVALEKKQEDAWANWRNPDESGKDNTSGIKESMIYANTAPGEGKGVFEPDRLYKAQFVQDKTYDLSQRSHVWLMRNIEEIILRDGTIIPKSTVFSGNVTVRSDKIMISVNRIKLKYKEIVAQLYVVDEQGNEGLRRQRMSEAMRQTDAQLDAIMNEATSDIGVSTPFGRITLPTRVSHGKTEIIITSSIQFYLKVK